MRRSKTVCSVFKFYKYQNIETLANVFEPKNEITETTVCDEEKRFWSLTYPSDVV